MPVPMHIDIVAHVLIMNADGVEGDGGTGAFEGNGRLFSTDGVQATFQTAHQQHAFSQQLARFEPQVHAAMVPELSCRAQVL